jgi:hypothetical protein
MALVALAALMSGGNATAQPCNPVIHGTYCASEPPRALSTPSASVSIQPIQNIARDLSLGQETPGTFGAITFRGDHKRCIGLLRRGACN